MRLISLHTDVVRALEQMRVPFDDLTPDGLWGSPYHLVAVTPEQGAVLDGWNVPSDNVTPRALGGGNAGKNTSLRPARPQSDGASVTSGNGPALSAGGMGPASGNGLRAPANAPRWIGTNGPSGGAPDGGTSAGASPGVNAGASNGIGHGGLAIDEPQPSEANVGELDDANGAAAVLMHGESKHQGDPLGESAMERELVGRAAAAAEAGHAPRAADKTGPTRLRVNVGGKYREASVQRGKIVLDGTTFDSPAQAAKSVSSPKSDWVFWEYFDTDAGKWRMLDHDWQPGRTA